MNDPDSLTELEYHAILRNDFRTFVERSFRELNPEEEFIAGDYIDLMTARLEKCRTGQIKRLINNLPPRTLKSHVASVAFPAFLLGHEPTKQIICASYGQDLADKHARDCRTIMRSSFYRELFPQAALSPHHVSLSDFMTAAGGFRMATSVGGVLTGRGADIIILDDVLKPEDALSETRRRATNAWYFNTLVSRLNNKEQGVIIIAMQRLHQEDLVGEVMVRERWEVLALPAIAVDNERYDFEDLFGSRTYERKIGEALHPERDSVETFQQIRQAIGEYNFQSQYQQQPTSREGGLIKQDWIQYFDPSTPLKDTYYILQSWDTACKGGDANDFSVCTTWAISGGNLYLLDVLRKRLTFPELKRAVVENFQKFNVSKVLFEDRSSGMSLLQEIRADEVYCIDPYTPEPGLDKYMRLSAQSIKFEQKRVYLPSGAPWLEEYLREITGFPGSKYDDQVDSTSQALDVLGRIAPFGDWKPFRLGVRGYETC